MSTHLYNSIDFNHEKRIREDYGFKVELDKNKWENAMNIFKNMPWDEYKNRPRKMAYHNLCIRTSPPPAAGQLLGLGLKFCIQSRDPSETDLELGIKRFERDVRLAYEFAGSDRDEVNKKIYIKSAYKSEPTDPILENMLRKFSNRIRDERTKILRNANRRTNLSTVQQNILKTLRTNSTWIILMCDKNLGPAIMERDEYILNVLKEHLMNGVTYRQLSSEEAKNRLEKLKEEINRVYDEHKTNLPSKEKLFFKRALNTQEYRTPQFYGMPKVHKNEFPVPLRPVISQCGSLSAQFSTYVDYILQKLVSTVDSYLKNSIELIRQLKARGRFPRKARLLTSDAKSMYTNINPQEGVKTLHRYLQKYDPMDKCNRRFICQLLMLILYNNVFQFGDTYWVQLVGTAMGTPMACIYATIFFAYYEQTILLPKYNKNILFFRCQIDNIFCVWVDDPQKPHAFKEFKEDLNKQCKLEWKTTNLSKSVDFLDFQSTMGILQQERTKKK